MEKGSGGTNTPNSLNFDQFLNHLVFEKYTNEYKLDKKTRAKTDEIIQDHLKRHQELRNVSYYLYKIPSSNPKHFFQGL